jgi:hypothetical protein
MENWIGVGIWIVLGVLVALAIKVLVQRPEEQPGHNLVLVILGAFAAVVGGMLGVGIFHFEDPVALSAGGMAGALFLSALMSWLYRWGIRALV